MFQVGPMINLMNASILMNKGRGGLPSNDASNKPRSLIGNIFSMMGLIFMIVLIVSIIIMSLFLIFEIMNASLAALDIAIIDRSGKNFALIDYIGQDTIQKILAIYMLLSLFMIFIIGPIMGIVDFVKMKRTQK